MLRHAQHERNINRLHRSPWACRRVIRTFYEIIKLYTANYSSKSITLRKHWQKCGFLIWL